jgi:uncharacterized CHY-type Zn-finger protein
MGNRFKNAGHLTRVALVFAGGLILFIIARGLVVPKSFGQLGHYRASALEDIAARAPRFAGREVCEGCHSDVADLKKTGAHAKVGCEACHGALAAHATDPQSVVPKLPDTAVLCVKCHEANSAKPAKFPQVVAKDHAGDTACGTCHQPHKPGINGDSK